MRTLLKQMAGLCVLLAALLITGCSNGTTDGTDNLPHAPRAGVYAGTSGSGDSSTTYTLTVYDNGDYILVIASGGTVKTSSGTVSGDKFRPQYPDSPEFTITIEDGGITGIADPITLDDGAEETAPDTVEPEAPETPASGNSIVGTWEPTDNVEWTTPTQTYFDSEEGIDGDDYDYRTFIENGKTVTSWTFKSDKLAEVLAVLSVNGIPYRGRTGTKGYEPGSAPPTEVFVEDDDSESFLVSNAGETDWAKFGNNRTLIISNDKLTRPPSSNSVSYSFNGTSLTVWAGGQSAIASAVINGDYLIIGQSTGFNIGGVYKRATSGN
jgi:hypothetical protein